jgi:hypothetical protein
MSAGDGIAGQPVSWSNVPAPERAAGEYTGDELSWVAGPGGAYGAQPRTSTNPHGTIVGIPLAVP